MPWEPSISKASASKLSIHPKKDGRCDVSWYGYTVLQAVQEWHNWKGASNGLPLGEAIKKFLAGIRTDGEIFRITWECFKWDRRIIDLSTTMTNINERRHSTIAVRSKTLKNLLMCQQHLKNSLPNAYETK